MPIRIGNLPRFSIRKKIMNKHLRILILLGILATTIFGVCAQTLDPKPAELQGMIKSAIGKGYAATVFITQYDTVAKRQTRVSRFSGVVVTEDGVILTAGHVCRPNVAYWITFPDNKQYLAIGAGRIAGLDAAVMKIKEPGSYPHAEIGWSSSMKINEPCISIAYPGSFYPQQPVVRLGEVVAHDVLQLKMMQTTCLMEPGDSGGPVFDLYGRVVGIRSNIYPDLKMNFDVPVDIFRRYWSSLLKPVDYQFLPKEEELPVDPLLTSRTYFTKAGYLNLQLSKTEQKLERYAVSLTCPGDTSQVMGTLIDIKGLTSNKALARKSFAISKSSLVNGNVTASLGNKTINGRAVFRDKLADLVLVEFESGMGTGVSISPSLPDSMGFSDLGNILICPNPAGAGKIGVTGTSEIPLPRSNIGYLGISLSVKDNKLVSESVNTNSPASFAGLIPGDVLISINGIVINTADEFLNEMRKNDPGDKINVVYKRKELQHQIDIVLGKWPSAPQNIADQYEGGRSLVFDGFNHAFVHDTKLLPSECGSPIFDLDGKFRGINMARYSRTSTIAVSPVEVLAFVKNAIANLIQNSKLYSINSIRNNFSIDPMEGKNSKVFKK